MTTKFETGKTYWTRSPCDHNCIIKMRVARRTAKTIFTCPAQSSLLVKPQLRVQYWDNGSGDQVEHVMPWGRSSMAPVLSADRVGEGPQ